MPSPPKSAPPLGAIDFELTDFEDARRSLDELPPGVLEAQRLRAGDWSATRRKPLATDRALTGAAMDWVIGLPPTLRPHETCEQFPRVVNTIAQAWPDVAYSLQLLEHMINDYRGGRRGFPVAVQRELQALYQHQRERAAR